MRRPYFRSQRNRRGGRQYEQRTLLLDVEKELLSEDPFRIRITIPLDGDELSLTFNDEMEAADVSR